MNSIKRSLILMGCCAGLVSGQSAYAADGTATASLDWSQLQVSVTGVDGNVPTVTFSDEYTRLSSSAYTPGEGSEYNTKSIYDWTSTIAANAEATATTFANAAASPLTVIATRATPDNERNYGVEGSGKRSRIFLAARPRKLT